MEQISSTFYDIALVIPIRYRLVTYILYERYKLPQILTDRVKMK